MKTRERETSCTGENMVAACDSAQRPPRDTKNPRSHDHTSPIYHGCRPDLATYSRVPHFTSTPLRRRHTIARSEADDDSSKYGLSSSSTTSTD